MQWPCQRMGNTTLSKPFAKAQQAPSHFQRSWNMTPSHTSCTSIFGEIPWKLPATFEHLQIDTPPKKKKTKKNKKKVPFNDPSLKAWILHDFFFWIFRFWTSKMVNYDDIKVEISWDIVRESSDIIRYCWWKKSCTTWHVWNLVNNGKNY